MSIRTSKSYKVCEQSHDGDGCGAILASFSTKVLGEGAEGAANERATRLARENPGTRYYVLATVSGVYEDGAGGIVRRNYP